MKRSILFAFILWLVAVGTLPPQHTLGQNRKPRGRALLVGVNDYQVKGISSTPGSVEDAEAFSQLLQAKGWFDKTEIHTLLGSQATATNIEREFRTWLINDTQPGDRVFFLYSGHGTQVPDDDGDERREDPGDNQDEAIAPYDVNAVNRRLVNYIRDDQFNRWLAQLGGRSIVLVFDSCNSGTVSRGTTTGTATLAELKPRYLPSPEQWDWSVQARSLADGSYVVTDGPASKDNDPTSRNLKLVVDKNRLAPNSLLAVFSAAQSNQLAWPMRTPSGLRGAFSYFFEQALRTGNPTLQHLRESLTANIRRAHQEGRLKGEQQPDFEISAPSLMNDQPLFATTTVPAQLPMLATGFTNSTSNLSISAQVGHLKNGRFQTDRSVFCYGEEVGYRLKTNAPGYLYLLVFSHDRKNNKDIVTVIYPAKNEKEFFEAGEHQLDGFPVQEPAGKDIVVVLLTKDKLALKEQIDARDSKAPPLNWKQVFDWLGSAELEQAVRQRGQGGRLSGKTLAQTEWQVAVLVTEAVERCDQISSLNPNSPPAKLVSLKSKRGAPKKQSVKESSFKANRLARR